MSGPIWGTAFLRAAVAAGDRTELTPDDVIAMLRAAIAGIMHRGEASLGDKTLLDALVPAVDSLEESFDRPHRRTRRRGLQKAADVAVKAAEDTKGMLAMRGRAAYTGERSRDSVDAGATAIGVILQAISAAWRDKYTHREQEADGVKKFVNDPRQFVPEMLDRHHSWRAAAPSSTSRSTTSSTAPTCPRTTRSRSSRARARATSRRTP